MEVGKIYKLGTDSGKAIVKLKDIQTYPSTGMPSDYLFEYQEGSIKPIVHESAEALFGSKDIFPIPVAMIPVIKNHPEYGIEEVV
jgi:hypothetical protein